MLDLGMSAENNCSIGCYFLSPKYISASDKNAEALRHDYIMYANSVTTLMDDGKFQTKFLGTTSYLASFIYHVP